jgi:hypothetical protein
MAKRIKVHPIGFIAIKAKNRADHTGETKKYVQTIRMKNGQIRTIQHYEAVSMFGGVR